MNDGCAGLEAIKYHHALFERDEIREYDGFILMVTAANLFYFAILIVLTKKSVFHVCLFCEHCVAAPSARSVYR